MNKFLTKENVIICVVVFAMIVQSNYFATKLDLANLKNDMSKLQIELQKYSDDGDKEILREIKTDIQEISAKIDRKHS